MAVVAGGTTTTGVNESVAGASGDESFGFEQSFGGRLGQLNAGELRIDGLSSSVLESPVVTGKTMRLF